MSAVTRLFTDTLSSTNLTALLAIFVAVLGGIWLWIQHHYAYWKRMNVPNIAPHPIFGNFKDLILSKIDPCKYFDQLYKHENAIDQPAVGLYVFNKPCLLIRDLDLVKSVLIKDFNKFSDRYASSDPHSDSVGADNLFFVNNPKWKQLRQKLSPIFTSGKIKQMFPLIEAVGRELDKHLLALTMDSKTNLIEREVKEINSLYTTDVIASAAFGISINSFRNPNNEFQTNGKRIFHFTRWRALEFQATFFLPSVVRLLSLKVFSKESSDFLRKTMNYVLDERSKSGAIRNDLIDLLLNFRKEAEAANTDDKKHFVLEGDCLVAQAATFFTAGFETASTTMSFSLYELARHQNVQERLREEIRETLQANDGKLTYEMVNEMKFLNNVIMEVLRFYPPLPFLDRECTLDKNEKSYSLQPHLDYAIPHGMPVYIPVSSLHKDPKYFVDPETFDPDRFTSENRHMVNMGAYMPFGTGPRNCIGERFALIQTKVGLINFLRNHYVTPCDKSHTTMKLEPRAIILQSEGGVHCNIVRDLLL